MKLTNGRFITGWWQLVPLGLLLGLIGGGLSPSLGLAPVHKVQTYEPAAYRMPAAPGMADLRLAMVHDVLCERYRKHGPAWDAAAQLAAEAVIAQDPNNLEAYDDAAMAAERRGERATAETLLRAKAARQDLTLPTAPESLACSDNYRQQYLDELKAVLASSPDTATHQRYRTLANLGTVLHHVGLPRVLRGDVSARPLAEQGLACLQASVRIEPSAHFGRERWQIVTVEHLLAAAAQPELLRTYDLIGDELGGEPAISYAHGSAWSAIASEFSRKNSSDNRFSGEFTQAAADAQASPEIRLRIRERIPLVGGEKPWITAVNGSRRCPVAFDQPVLGILGMWTLGSGGNAHFALCLATVMERIGQGSLAWEAYERTVEFAPGYSPDADTRAWLITHCRTRQAQLATTHGGDSWQTAMRAGFHAELQAATDLRTEYHAWEAQRLAAGGNVVDDAAESAWWAAKPPLGSPTGTTDERHASIRPQLPNLGQSMFLALIGALVGCAVAIILEAPKRRRSAP